MAFCSSLTNDEVKHRVVNIYAKFVSDVEPDRLCDWLVQEGVITPEQSKEIRCENQTKQKRCRALLDMLFSTQHPTAFRVVLQALYHENSYLLDHIVNQSPDRMETIRNKSKAEENSQSTELNAAQLENRNLKERIRELEKELQVFRLASTQLPKEPRNFNRVNQLEGEPRSENLPTEYKSDPVFVQTIRTNETKINGLAILKRELFVVNGESSEVDIYDAMKFSFSRRWSLQELIDPMDIISCNRNKCLYIFDYKGDDQSKEILRVDLSGKLIKKWSTGNNYGRLSVTNEPSIILAVFNKPVIHEYSPCGPLIREINLSSSLSIINPYRAIKLANGHFVVSHGSVRGDGQHGVCLVDDGGKVVKIFGGKRECTFLQVNEPVCLFVDRNGFVLVADRDNHRVLLLDADLKFKRELLTGERHALRHPRRILLDEPNGRLFVADNKWDSKDMTYKDGQISIFHI